MWLVMEVRLVQL